MILNKSKIALKPIQNEDILLLSGWLDKVYIRKWFGEKEDWLKGNQ